MSTFLPSPAGTRTLIRPLASSMRTGKPYSRHPDVEAEIQTLLRLPQSEWMAKAGELHSETIVFLMRLVRYGNEQLFHHLFQELSARIVVIAGRWTSTEDAMTAEEIVSEVEVKILELVLADTPSRQSDFLEIAFGKAVQCHTLDRVRKHDRSPLGGRRAWMAANDDDDEDADDFEEDLPSIEPSDDRPGPEAIVLQAEQETRRRDWIQKASKAIKDPRHLQAVLLHYIDGWPISSSDPKIPDLASFFDTKPRQVKYWIAKALREMRAAIGEEI